MIARPKPSISTHAALPSAAAVAMPVPVPNWLRRAVADTQSLAGKEIEDVAAVTGAAIGALDAAVRRQERCAGAWRRRLALSAAAVTAKQAGRVEDEAALRDMVVLTRPADSLSGSATPGPAGLLLLAWRRLAGRPAQDLLTAKSLAAVMEEFGYAPDAAMAGDLVDELRPLGADVGMVAMLAGAFVAAERHGFGRAVGAWLADALLARRLGWTHAVPLLGTEVVAGLGTGRPRRSGIVLAAASTDEEGARAKSLLAGQARAALRAIDLSAELGRRADRLLALAPKLRAKASDLVIERLLSDDAVVASERIAGMSDRGLRRLFDRLVSLSTVRELSGRPTFRIYGL